MLQTRRLGGLGLAAAFLLLTACSDSLSDIESAAEDAQLNLDVAAYVADATTDDIAMMTDEFSRVLPAPFASGPSFQGPGAGRLSDYEVSRTVTFFNEADEEMDGFDPVLTSYIHMLLEMEGSRTRQGDRGTITQSVSRSRDMIISGLLGEETERTWNGTGSSAKAAVVVSDADGERSYNFSATSVITDVVIPVPRGSGWPLSGQIERTVTTERIDGDEVQTRTRNVVVEFNGSHLVPIWINGELYTLNLETREILQDTDET